MKKSKIYLSFATVILATVGFIATKANKKYVPITCVCVKIGPVQITICGLPGAHFTNVYVSGVTKTVYLKTVAGALFTLRTSCNTGAKKVYYH